MRTSAYQPSPTSDIINQQLNRLNSFVCFHLSLIRVFFVCLWLRDCRGWL